MATPNSYKDPYWSDLADKASAKVGAPAGVLKSILLYGEKSNNDQVSSAGAKTPFQITTTTAKLIEKKYGIDPYLSDENAAEGAALLIKESADRNKGNIDLTVREYHGGTNPKNWGPINDAYVKRVMGGVDVLKSNAISSDFNKWATENGFNSTSSTQSDQVKQIGADFSAAMAPKASEAVPTKGAALDVSKLSADFNQWQANKANTPEPPKELGLIDSVNEAISGAQRSTPESRSLPEWTGMPERSGKTGLGPDVLPGVDMAKTKVGLGTMFAGPEEITQIIKANFPDTQVRQDAKGNYILKSSIDGKEYVIPPGITVNDIPRIMAGFLAFGPATGAISKLGMEGAKGLVAQTLTSAAGSTAVQAGIENSQVAAGGNFSSADVAAAGLAGGLLPPVIAGAGAAVRGANNMTTRALSKLMGPNDARMAQGAAAATPEAAPVMQAAPSAPVQATANAVTPMTSVELASVARKAGLGDAKAVQTLAEQAMPNAKTVQAAKNIGIDGLQLDHVSTNQAFIELNQMLKSVPTSQISIAEKAVLTNASKAADDVITKLGGTDDLAGVSGKVQKELQGSYDTLKAKASKIYDDISEKLVDTAVPAPAPKTIAFINARAKTLGGAENLTTGERDLLKKLAPKGDKEPTYALLDQSRKEIGAAKRGAQNVFGSSDSKLLGDLENVLRSDQSQVVNAHGFGSQWEVANGLTKQYKGIQNDLTALFGKSLNQSITTDIKSSMGALSKGDTSKFINLIKSVPESMRQEVTATGLTTVLDKSANTFGSYATWYEGLLKNKQAHTAVMANLPPSARKSLSDLYRVSKSINDATKTKIPTGRLSEGMKRLNSADTLAGKIFENLKYDMPANVAGTAAGVASSAVAGPMVGGGIGLAIKGALTKGARTEGALAAEKVLMSPEFKETVIQAAAGRPEVAAKKLASSVIFVDFVKKAKIPDMSHLSDRERWILQALESNPSQQSNSR